MRLDARYRRRRRKAEIRIVQGTCAPFMHQPNAFHKSVPFFSVPGLSGLHGFEGP
jgi:hypothetical protein